MGNWVVATHFRCLLSINTWIMPYVILRTDFYDEIYIAKYS